MRLVMTVAALALLLFGCNGAKEINTAGTDVQKFVGDYCEKYKDSVETGVGTFDHVAKFALVALGQEAWAAISDEVKAIVEDVDKELCPDKVVPLSTDVQKPVALDSKADFSAWYGSASPGEKDSMDKSATYVRHWMDNPGTAWFGRSINPDEIWNKCVEAAKKYGVAEENWHWIYSGAMAHRNQHWG